MAAKVRFVLLVLLVFLGACAAQKEAVVVGAVLPLSGPAAYTGEQARNGVLMAVEEINSKGGINGHEVIVVFEDSQTNPTAGVTAFQKLLNFDDPDIVISALSSVSMAVAPLALENEVPVIGLMVTAPDFTKDNRWVFRYYPRAEDEVGTIKLLLEEVNAKKLGVLYMNDEYGTNVHRLVKEWFDTRGVVLSEGFNAPDSDFRTQISKLLSGGVDSIYVVGFDSHFKNAVRQLNELRFSGNILGTSTASLPGVREGLGRLSDGLYVAAPVLYGSAIPEKAGDFLANYEAAHGEPASHYAAVGYDAVHLFAGSLDSTIVSPQSVKGSLELLNQFSGVFGKVGMQERNHEISYKLHPARIENQRVVYLS